MKKLSVIIVNYNVCQFLEQALRSVYKSLENIPSEVFVVDNCSVDGSVEMVQKKFPQTQLIINTKNVGFSSANNQAIKLSTGEYVLLLNPDTVVEEDTMSKCVEFMDTHPNAGGLGVKMIDGKGNFLPESKRSLPTPWVAFYKIFGLASLFPYSKKFGKYHLKYLSDTKTHPVEVLAGACMLLRKSVLDTIGLLDEDYFMYGEDIDLSYRILQAGYQNYYFADTRIIHYKGESTKKTSINYVFIFYNAMVIFAQKHFSTNKAKLFSILIHLAIYLRAGIGIGKRFFHTIVFPMLDSVSIYLGILAFNNARSTYLNMETSWYPPYYQYVDLPLFVFLWLTFVYYSGGYDKPYHWWRTLRGFLFGSLVIAALSYFIPYLSYSRLAIPFGALWGFVAFTFIRWVGHSIENKKFIFSPKFQKRLLVIGEPDENFRLSQLLNDAGIQFKLAGLVSPKNIQTSENIFKLKEMIEIFKIDEVIFCSKDLGNNQIMDIMSRIDNRIVSFKIFPEESDFVIGSNSADSQGDIYMANINFAITQPGSIRNKRMFDLAISIAFFIGYPVLIFWIKNPFQFFRNIVSVAISTYSWVGFTKKEEMKLPMIKEGILSTISHLKLHEQQSNYSKRADLQYAKNYSIYTDFNIIIKSFHSLGNKPN